MEANRIFWFKNSSVYKWPDTVPFQWLSNIPCVPHLLCPFICQWLFRLLLCPGYCKSCCSEHWDTCVFLSCIFSGHMPRSGVVGSWGVSFFGDCLITNTTFSLIGLFRLSVSPQVSLGRLYVSRNLSVSYRLPVFLACKSYWSLKTLFISVLSVVRPLFRFWFWSSIFRLANVCQFCLFFQKTNC